MNWHIADQIRRRHRIPSGTMAEMQGEVAALVARGVDVAEACEIIGLPQALYYDGCSAAIEFLPTPQEIDRATQRIRSGEFDRGKARGRRRKLAALASVRDDDETFELGGTIADDQCRVPAWLYSADSVDRANNCF